MVSTGAASVAIVDSTHNRYVQVPDIEATLLDGIADVIHEVVDGSDGLGERLAGYDAIISWHAVALDRVVLAKLTRCVGIVRAAVGFDNIDIAFAAERGIAVANIPDYGTEEVADHTMALILALARNLINVDRRAKEGVWDWRIAGSLPRLRGKRLGIVGMGRIGTAVSRRAGCFGLDIGFYDPYVPVGLDKALGVCRLDTLEELAEVCDIITLHVPLTPATHHMISDGVLRRMKPEAILVNTSRGPAIEESALVAAVAEGRIGAVGLDVLEDEPRVHPVLRTARNVALTAHSAFYSRESLVELRTNSARAVARLLRGEPEPRTVNGVITASGHHVFPAL
ncbi:C-terminal binding protein [Streptomyces olivochromogenes]|uniref:C-terminal binding protein n=1 Tax=Streptomyces olivochromogenes TaxID=1963 RepID=UPI0036DC3B72